MGLLDFWKKKDDLGISSDMPVDMGSSMTSDPLHSAMESSSQNAFNPASINAMSNMQFQSQPAMQTGPTDMQKDMQILSLKLDAIKAELDSINQRIKNIETIAEREAPASKNQKRWY